MGLRNFTHAQPIITERWGASEEWVWYPYTEDKVEQLKKAAHYMFRTPIRWLMR